MENREGIHKCFPSVLKDEQDLNEHSQVPKTDYSTSLSLTMTTALAAPSLRSSTFSNTVFNVTEKVFHICVLCELSHTTAICVRCLISNNF